MEWLLQLLLLVIISFSFNSHVDKTLSAFATNSSSVSPLSLSPTFHSAASFPPVTS